MKNIQLDGFQLSSMDFIPGTEIEVHFGLVSGSTVRSKHIGRDILAGFKNIFGGELKGYTELMNETRDEALGRAIEIAKRKGANAIVSLRFATSDVASGAAEVYVYGTAVKLK